MSASRSSINSSRKLPEWVGKTPDTPVPPRVKLRVFERYHGRCYLSGIQLRADQWETEHIIALINGGENRENNLAPVAIDRHKEKSRQDLKIKSKSYRIRKRNAGIRKKSKFPGSKDSPWKRKLDGTWVRR